MQMSPYLSFDGNCADALRFYARIFGGEPDIQTYGETPMAGDFPKETHGRVMHGFIDIGGAPLMAADAPPGTYESPQGISVTVQVDSNAEGKRIFDALAEGGTVTMAFEKTFWSEGFGMVKDRFGIPWMVNVS